MSTCIALHLQLPIVTDINIVHISLYRVSFQFHPGRSVSREVGEGGGEDEPPPPANDALLWRKKGMYISFRINFVIFLLFVLIEYLTPYFCHQMFKLSSSTYICW